MLLTLIPYLEQKGNMRDGFDPKEMLIGSVTMGLKKHKYAKPRSLDATQNDRYYHGVATQIVEQIKLTWEFTRKSDGQKVE